MANKNTYLVLATLPNGDKIQELFQSKTKRAGKLIPMIDSAFQGKYQIRLRDLMEIEVYDSKDLQK